MTGKLLQATKEENKYICPICRGWGHDYFECGTKKKLDAWAKSNGDSANWGNWKWVTYYSNIDPEQRERDCKAAWKFWRGSTSKYKL